MKSVILQISDLPDLALEPELYGIPSCRPITRRPLLTYQISFKLEKKLFVDGETDNLEESRLKVSMSKTRVAIFHINCSTHHE